MERRILTVTALNEYIKSVFDGDPLLDSVWVSGEISNFTNHYKTGHFYFTLKDASGLIRVVMFRTFAMRLPFLPESGMKVLVRGRVTVFPRDGQYQIYCEEMEPDGVGSLYFAFEQLKRKLAEQGLFSAEKKKPIPKIPTRIGVITSPTGAAVRDILHILGRRFPYAKVVVYPALVQGSDAPPQLIRALRYFNETNSADVIILGRGGGSLEDLWAFNSEELAHAVYDSKIPVISAVGHETDFTICDFVADLRAPTPSAAAELAVPEMHDLMRRIQNVVAAMRMTLLHNTALRRHNLEQMAQRISARTVRRGIEEERMELDHLADQILRRICLKRERGAGHLSELAGKLTAMNPLAILNRGYAVAFSGGCTLKSVSQVQKGDRIYLRLSDGRVEATATSVEKADDAQRERE